MKVLFFSMLLSVILSVSTFGQTGTGKSVLNIVGTLKCTSCDLKGEEGAKARCSVYGHQYAIKTAKVSDKKGDAQPQLQGKVYSILLNDASKPLAQEKNRGKEFKIKGKIFESDGVIEIESYQ